MAQAKSESNFDEYFQYNECLWGDVIFGSKNLLQKIGIGTGQAFPGEEGAPIKRLTTIDPRGFKCKVELAAYKGPGIFVASIRFPGREQLFGLSEWERYAEGVQKKKMFWFDSFIGTSADLTAAKLVPAGHFPGMPGMRKTRVTIFADGSMPYCLLNANYGRYKKGPGTKLIERVSKTKYQVDIVISDELAEQRRLESNHNDEVWEARMKLLPRPPRIDRQLRTEMDQSINATRPGLRLVWSKPRFVPEFID